MSPCASVQLSALLSTTLQTDCTPCPSTPLHFSQHHSSTHHPPQELPCGHPILTAYQSDLRQRLALAAAATNPQGTPLLRTHEQHVGADNPTAASPSVHNSQPPAGATLGSSSSSGVGSGDNDLVFRGSSWVVGVDKATGVRAEYVHCSLPYLLPVRW